MPSDELLEALVATAERRWRMGRFDKDFDVRVITDWLWDEDMRNDEHAAATVIDAANDLRTRAAACGRSS